MPILGFLARGYVRQKIAQVAVNVVKDLAKNFMEGYNGAKGVGTILNKVV